jgi:hypothetical protein
MKSYEEVINLLLIPFLVKENQISIHITLFILSSLIILIPSLYSHKNRYLKSESNRDWVTILNTICYGEKTK